MKIAKKFLLLALVGMLCGKVAAMEKSDSALCDALRELGVESAEDLAARPFKEQKIFYRRLRRHRNFFKDWLERGKIDWFRKREDGDTFLYWLAFHNHNNWRLLRSVAEYIAKSPCLSYRAMHEIDLTVADRLAQYYLNAEKIRNAFKDNPALASRSMQKRLIQIALLATVLMPSVKWRNFMILLKRFAKNMID